MRKAKKAVGKTKIDIRGDDSRIVSLSRREQAKFRGHPELVKRASYSKKEARRHDLALCIANLLYPKKFPKVIASKLSGRTTYAERVPLDKKSQQAIEEFYRVGPFYGGFYKEHVGRIRERLEKEVDRIFKESGIWPESKGMNVGVKRSGTLFYFEINQIHIPTLEKRINRLQTRTPEQRIRKKQLILLLDMLKKEAKGKDVIYTYEW